MTDVDRSPTGSLEGLDLSLKESYRGKGVLLTGGTGFLGTALVEKTLRSLPELGRLYLLIRSGSKSAQERFEKDLLASPAFQALREEKGDAFLDYARQKVRVVAGDTSREGLGLSERDREELSENVDVVIHSAASVMFDAPLDAAVASNVRGTLALLHLARGWKKRPLFVHISTAYVAGKRAGLIREEPPRESTPNASFLDPDRELAHLDAVVREVEETARRKSFETDEAREEWKTERLVARGNERAQEYGWHDVYTFTKSLAERLVLKERGEVPVVIVRPAIIESSLAEPYPGWIVGTKMADPIIMAFARGILREFPGNPESLIDIVPVDHVVNATLAAGALRPEEPEVFQVASGQRNPLRYRDLYEYVRGYFLDNPLRDSGGRPLQPHEWTFPGSRAVERRLRLEMLGLKAAGALVQRLPEGHLALDLRQKLSRAEKRSQLSLYFSRIYGGYANMASTFASERTTALYEALPESERREFPFDIGLMDWEGWLWGAHLPALTTRPDRKKRRRSMEKPKKTAAIFDVDGTLIDSNVVSYFAWLKLRELPKAVRPFWLAAFLLKAPYYWALDKVSRTHFNRRFYRNYRGWRPERARQLGAESFAAFTLARVHPEALAQLRRHKEAGHEVVLLSGALDFILAPLGDLADDVVSAKLQEEGGVYTGELSGVPVAGDARARMLASYARRNDLDLSKSYAYADSISDFPMLEAVGYPVAVNPDGRLEKAARERGWQIRTWGREQNGVSTPVEIKSLAL
ncbi:HAD-SF-IB-hyp1: HAD hydrolase, family IB [Rubrobacter radiotolerans]|uniref:HAD-IB family hydrolase n=1 Tax=Rubrobacter radiotolerans TaxID=42256 RepID=A0A023X5A7_RUBRA|nr:HAD-IB family hydrolase [Rubrobacter radiotolerans]AHY47180.1 HAD-SF-IB-hyp1: HAD hydrolase, family IB [Rubrobacter radiotolerans]MDX5894583.1 HAD-IB family hydrolase [Rubrobacter radiotolerans]SMC06319.1 HAD-superfamily subfamily IB hydrolase, TIGR01490 [Rubrobacter radiotolerans DSM 5868]